MWVGTCVSSFRSAYPGGTTKLSGIFCIGARSELEVMHEVRDGIIHAINDDCSADRLKEVDVWRIGRAIVSNAALFLIVAVLLDKTRQINIDRRDFTLWVYRSTGEFCSPVIRIGICIIQIEETVDVKVV